MGTILHDMTSVFSRLHRYSELPLPLVEFFWRLVKRFCWLIPLSFLVSVPTEKNKKDQVAWVCIEFLTIVLVWNLKMLRSHHPICPECFCPSKQCLHTSATLLKSLTPFVHLCVAASFRPICAAGGEFSMLHQGYLLCVFCIPMPSPPHSSPPSLFLAH